MKSIHLRSIIAFLLFWGNVTVAVLQAEDFSVIKTIDVDTAPFGITPSPDGRTMWVANSGGVPAQGGPPNSDTITIIDIDTLEKQTAKIKVGKFPEDIVFSKEGRYAVVTNSTDGTVSIIEAASRKVVQTLSIAPAGLGYPFGVIFNKNNSKLFVTTGGSYDKAIAVLDSRYMNQVRLAGTVSVPGYPGRPLFLAKDNRLLVPTSPSQIGTAQLFVIDPDSAKIKRELHMPTDKAFANDIVVSSDGRFAYVSLFALMGGHGGVWVVDLRSFKTATVIDTGDSVFGMGITPDGKFVFATNFNRNQVVVINPNTNKIITSIPVGSHPNKVAVSLDGKEAFVTNQGSTTVSVIAIPGK